MGESCLNICTYPLGQEGLRILSEKLEVPGLYLPMTWNYKKIDHQLLSLCEHMGLDLNLLKSWIDPDALKKQCEKSLEETASCLKGKRVALDASATPQVLGLARLLLSHGISVTHIYGDAFLPEEKEDWEWLKEHAQDLEICSVIHHSMRVRPRIPDDNLLAVGQKAAYFGQTPYFVNMVEGSGLHGYDGILTMLQWIREASTTKREIEDTIRRKGLGCPCLLPPLETDHGEDLSNRLSGRSV